MNAAPASPGTTPTPLAPPKPKELNRTAILVVLGIFLSLLMGALDNFVVLTALPNIVTDLHQPTGITFIVSAYLIGGTVSVPIFAKLSDLLSRRDIFLSGLVIFIAGSALAGLSQNLDELIVFRGVQGFGSGGFFPIGIAIIAVLFSPETRARLTGVFSGVFGIATVAGPFLGSFIVDHTSWRWVFYINIPIGLLGMAVLRTTLGPLRPAVRGTFDLGGAALLSAWVSALMLALVQVSDAGWAWTDPRILALLLASVVLFVVFLFWELRTSAPLVPVRLFKDRVVASSSGAVFLSRFAMFPLITFVAVYVGIVILHGSSSAADTVRDVLYFLVIPMVLGAVLGGQLLTRLSYRVLLMTGMTLATLGSLGLALVTSSTPTWTFAFGILPTGGIILPLIPIGLGLGFSFAAPLMAVQYQLPAKDVGAATGLVQFIQSLGGAMGVSLLASFQEARFTSLKPLLSVTTCGPGGPTTPSCLAYASVLQNALVTSYDNVFAVMLGFFVAALVVSAFLTGRLPKGRHPRSSESAGPPP